MKQPYVSTLIEQDFSNEEKALARENIAALSSADLGAYATKTWVSDNFLSDGDFREFATHEEVASATSGKMDATEASAFYPRYSNPEGYLTSIPSEYVTESEMSSYVSQETSAFITSADIPPIPADLVTSGELATVSGEIVSQIPSLQGYATEQYVQNYTSAFITSADLPDVSDMATKTWTSNNYYPNTNPSHFITSADVPAQIEYSAGQNVSINNHVISATDTTYSAGTGLSLNGTTFNNTAPNVKSDWNAAAGSASEILNKPTIPSKTSQLQNDSGFITSASIPSVNDATLTIQKNGSSVATFTANASVNVSADIAVPELVVAQSTSHGPSYESQDKITIWPSNGRVTTTHEGTNADQGWLIPEDPLQNTASVLATDGSGNIEWVKGIRHDVARAYPVAYSYATETPVSIMGGAATLTLSYSPAASTSSSDWSPVTFFLTLANTSKRFYVTSKLFDETQIGVVLTGSGASPNGNRTNLTTLMTGTGPSLSANDNSEKVELEIYTSDSGSPLEPWIHAHVVINRIYQTPSGASGTGPLIFVTCEYEA